jgi:CheY-like chemotaxis protein/two-component sensor histidine kinase
LSKLLSENSDGNLTDEQVKYAQTVYTSGVDLLSLINEILDLSKIEAGKMPIDPQSVQLFEVRDYLEQTFQYVADQKALSFEIRMDADLPTAMFTDVKRLEQILKNLLSNAFKFTAKGGVTVLIRQVAGESWLSFAVEDTGIGIPEDKQQLIFEAFQQADGTTSRKYGGTGLGLTISREMARLLGGRIEVVSAPGQGSTFTLYLPLVYEGPDSALREDSTAADEPRVYNLPRLSEGASFEGTKVLLVDDDVRNIFALRTVLESRGIRVPHAENGRDALELLQADPEIDLVVMDIMMPEMDGLAAMRAIRKMPRFATLPIIALTAKAMKVDRMKAMEAGATDFVVKPVDPERLLSMIDFWRTSREREQQSLAMAGR